MKHTSIHIAIPTPCHENWDKMDATERGAFCHSCSKEVIDFSTMTDAEVIAYLSKHKSGCGRFREDQIDRKLSVARIKNDFLNWRALVLGLLSIGAVKTLMAALPFKADMAQYDEAKKQNGTDTTKVSIDSTPPILGKIALSAPLYEDSAKSFSISVHGKVLNHRKEKFEAVKVEVSDSSGRKQIMQTTTDSSGNFAITIDEIKSTDPPLILKVSHWDYRSQTIKLNKDPDQEVNITLDEYIPRMLKGDYKLSR